MWRQFRAKVSKGLAFRYGCPDGECPDAFAAEASAALLLQSSVADDDSHFWRASLTFPDADQSEAPLTIQVGDARGVPVQGGTFIMFGIEIPIVDGGGQLTRTQLAECHHKGGSAFRWQDGCVVPGAPVLNV